MSRDGTRRAASVLRLTTGCLHLPEWGRLAPTKHKREQHLRLIVQGPAINDQQFPTTHPSSCPTRPCMPATSSINTSSELTAGTNCGSSLPHARLERRSTILFRCTYNPVSSISDTVNATCPRLNGPRKKSWPSLCSPNSLTTNSAGWQEASRSFNRRKQ